MQRLASGVCMVACAAAGVWTLSLSRVEAQSSPERVDHRAEFNRQWFWTNEESKRRELQRLIGKPAPSLTVGPWHGVSPGSLSELRGKIVLVDFWATWCGPCRNAVPHTNEVMARFAEKGVVVIGVCGSDERRGGGMIDVARKTGMKFPTAQDVNNRTALAWGVQWLPFYIIVDRQGIVRAAGLRPDKIVDALEEMLKEQPAPAGE